MKKIKKKKEINRLQRQSKRIPVSMDNRLTAAGKTLT